MAFGPGPDLSRHFIGSRRSEGGTEEARALQEAGGVIWSDARGPMNKEQYPIIAARRQAYDTLLWQMPAVAIAAQGFLLNAAIDGDTPERWAIILSLGSCFVAFAALQFFQRLRFMEVYDSVLLHEFELANERDGFATLHGPRIPRPDVRQGRLAKLRAFSVWHALLIGFTGLSFVAVVAAAVRLSS